MRQTIRSFRWLLSLYVLAQTLHSATYVLFLQKHGLDFFEVNLVNFCFFATLFAFEIPTGAFADVFGRKPSFLIASLLWGIGLAVYGYSDTMPMFIVSEMILAIGATFFSGAFEAWYVDSIIYHGQESELQKFLSHKEQLERWVGIFGMLAGAALAQISFSWPWYAGAISMFLAFLIACKWMKEEYWTASDRPLSASEIKRTAKVSIEYGWKNPAVRFLILVGTFQFFAMQPSNMFWAPHYASFVDSVMWIGVIRVGMQLMLIIGARYAVAFVQKVGDYQQALLLAQILIGMSLALSGLPWLAFSLSMFGIHEVGRGVFRPIKSKFLHANIPSSERATISSFESLVNHLGGAIGLLVAGLLAELTSVPISWLCFGLALAFVSGWQYLQHTRKKTVT